MPAYILPDLLLSFLEDQERVGHVGRCVTLLQSSPSRLRCFDREAEGVRSDVFPGPWIVGRGVGGAVEVRVQALAWVVAWNSASAGRAGWWLVGGPTPVSQDEDRVGPAEFPASRAS